jgi:hypothetical protein
MMAQVACVVEGHGEVESVPIILRRIVGEIDPTIYVDVTRPIRIPRSRLVKPGEVERAVLLANAKIGSGGGILVLVDADDDCPALLGPDLLHRARAVLPEGLLSVVLAKYELEAWFLAAAASIAGHRGLPAPLAPPAAAEGIRNAKNWIAERMPAGRGYSETLDQPALAATFNLAEARASASFDKLVREVNRWLASGIVRPQGA